MTWIGTDTNGDSLISSSERLLMFEKYNLNSMYESFLLENTDPMTNGTAV